MSTALDSMNCAMTADAFARAGKKHIFVELGILRPRYIYTTLLQHTE